jgi:hypothetical protein
MRGIVAVMWAGVACFAGLNTLSISANELDTSLLYSGSVWVGARSDP